MPDDVERIVALAQTLSTVSSLKSLCDVLAGPLASLLPASEICLVAASNGAWEVVLSATDAHERLADYAWTPLIVEGRTTALLGLGPAMDDGSPFGAAVASLLKIGIRNVLVIENLRERSARDGLTGCFSRGHGMQVLEAEMRRAARSRLPLSILMLDIDRFKEINDRDGHVAGDCVLAAVGERLLRRLRQSDTPCRFGGDEFLVILPETSPAAATQLAETLRRSFEQRAVPSPRGAVAVSLP
jgi:diguanylate cyclase (GGDEF)-like protein